MVTDKGFGLMVVFYRIIDVNNRFENRLVWLTKKGGFDERLEKRFGRTYPTRE